MWIQLSKNVTCMQGEHTYNYEKRAVRFTNDLTPVTCRRIGSYSAFYFQIFVFVFPVSHKGWTSMPGVQLWSQLENIIMKQLETTDKVTEPLTIKLVALSRL